MSRPKQMMNIVSLVTNKRNINYNVKVSKVNKGSSQDEIGQPSDTLAFWTAYTCPGMSTDFLRGVTKKVGFGWQHDNFFFALG